MSRETLLDDAITKAKEAEDWQLVEWLRMARGGESAAKWYTAKLGEARLDMSKLMTENTKLREQGARLFDKTLELATENDKLRELVKDMWPHVRHRSRMCDECDLPCDTSDECLLYEPMRQRMRQLGIGVE